MRHHAQTIVGPDLDGPVELKNWFGFGSCWGGPAELSTKGNPPPVDNYPPDVLAACPKAREWGVVLAGPMRNGQFEWRTADGKYYRRHDGVWAEQWCEVDGVGGNRQEALANPPTTPPHGYVAPPAQPSVGERLAQVCYEAFHNGNPPEEYPHFAPSFLPAAQAVRREVLAEPWAEEDIQAADTAFQASPGLESRRWVVAALSAALASRCKRAEREGSK
jgi:hypothetical protein